MYIFLIVVHVIVCFVLIATILLQAGRGGGLTEAFSGETQSVLGTQAPAVLKKATEVSAIVFLITSLVLGIVTARRGKSLFERGNLPTMTVTQQEVQGPAAAGPEEAVPVESLPVVTATENAAAEVDTPIQAEAAVN